MKYIKLFEEYSISEAKPETSSYSPPNNMSKIPDNDTGFELVKKSYNRMMWTWNKYLKNKKKKDITTQ